MYLRMVALFLMLLQRTTHNSKMSLCLLLRNLPNLRKPRWKLCLKFWRKLLQRRWSRRSKSKWSKQLTALPRTRLLCLLELLNPIFLAHLRLGVIAPVQPPHPIPKPLVKPSSSPKHRHHWYSRKLLQLLILCRSRISRISWTTFYKQLFKRIQALSRVYKAKRKGSWILMSSPFWNKMHSGPKLPNKGDCRHWGSRNRQWRSSRLRLRLLRSRRLRVSSRWGKIRWQRRRCPKILKNKKSFRQWQLCRLILWLSLLTKFKNKKKRNNKNSRLQLKKQQPPKH